MGEIISKIASLTLNEPLVEDDSKTENYERRNTEESVTSTYTILSTMDNDCKSASDLLVDQLTALISFNRVTLKRIEQKWPCHYSKSDIAGSNHALREAGRSFLKEIQKSVAKKIKYCSKDLDRLVAEAKMIINDRAQCRQIMERYFMQFCRQFMSHLTPERVELALIERLWQLDSLCMEKAVFNEPEEISVKELIGSNFEKLSEFKHAHEICIAIENYVLVFDRLNSIVHTCQHQVNMLQSLGRLVSSALSLKRKLFSTTETQMGQSSFDLMINVQKLLQSFDSESDLKKMNSLSVRENLSKVDAADERFRNALQAYQISQASYLANTGLDFAFKSEFIKAREYYQRACDLQKFQLSQQNDLDDSQLAENSNNTEKCVELSISLGKPETIIDAGPNFISITILKDLNYLVTGGDHELRFYDLRFKLLVRHFGENVSDMKPFKKNQLITASNANLLIWNAETGECVNKIENVSMFVFTVELNKSHSLLLAGGAGQVVLVDMENFQVIRSYSGHTSWIRSVTFNEAKNQLISGSDDKSIRIWNANDNTSQRTLTGHRGTVTKLVIDEQTGWLYSTSYDKSIREWNVDTGECLRSLTGHTDWIRDLIVTRTKLVSASHDHTILVWSKQNGQVTKTLSSTSGFWRLALNPINGQLISSTCDGEVVFWV